MKNDKARCQKVHFTKRCIERYGEVLSNAQISLMIQRGETISSKKLTNTRTEHTIFLNNKRYRVVYDKERKQCCTILPTEQEITQPSSPF